MMLAPARTNLIAPRSTPTRGRRLGSVAGRARSASPRKTARERRELTLVQDPQSGEVGTVKVLEEEGLAVQGEDRDGVLAVGVERVRSERAVSFRRWLSARSREREHTT